MANKYKVYFSGFAIVEADSEEEAEEALGNDEDLYAEWEITEVEQFDETNPI